MRNRNLLVFDLDGVIVNNTLKGFEKINKILAELNLPPVSEEFLRKNWGKKWDDMATFICNRQGATEEQLVYFKKRDKEINQGGIFDRRLLNALIALPEFGFLTAVITSRERMDLVKYSREIGLNLNIFHYVQTTDDYHICKPNGDVFEPLLQWAYNLGTLTAKNIAYFGDTIQYDYQAVKDANHRRGHPIKFIGICSGINTYEEFLAAGLKEKEIITSPDALSFYLNRLIQVKVEA